MPSFNHYECNKCDFELPSGWGGFLFVENDRRERIKCKHPGEILTIQKVLAGSNLTRLIKRRTIKDRVGFASYCVCLDCLHQFTADLADEQGGWRNYYKDRLGMVGGKDKRKCPKCKSKNIKTVFELINKECPKCHEGTIQEIVTGLMM